MEAWLAAHSQYLHVSPQCDPEHHHLPQTALLMLLTPPCASVDSYFTSESGIKHLTGRSNNAITFGFVFLILFYTGYASSKAMFLW